MSTMTRSAFASTAFVSSRRERARLAVELPPASDAQASNSLLPWRSLLDAANSFLPVARGLALGRPPEPEDEPLLAGLEAAASSASLLLGEARSRELALCARKCALLLAYAGAPLLRDPLPPAIGPQEVEGAPGRADRDRRSHGSRLRLLRALRALALANRRFAAELALAASSLDPTREGDGVGSEFRFGSGFCALFGARSRFFGSPASPTASPMLPRALLVDAGEAPLEFCWRSLAALGGWSDPGSWQALTHPLWGEAALGALGAPPAAMAADALGQTFSAAFVGWGASERANSRLALPEPEPASWVWMSGSCGSFNMNHKLCGAWAARLAGWAEGAPERVSLLLDPRLLLNLPPADAQRWLRAAREGRTDDAPSRQDSLLLLGLIFRFLGRRNTRGADSALIEEMSRWAVERGVSLSRRLPCSEVKGAGGALRSGFAMSRDGRFLSPPTLAFAALFAGDAESLRILLGAGALLPSARFFRETLGQYPEPSMFSAPSAPSQETVKGRIRALYESEALGAQASPAPRASGAPPRL
jgi:hypothetical protein